MTPMQHRGRSRTIAIVIAAAALIGASALPRAAIASTKRFFAPDINGVTEAGDMLANRIFAENCQDETSKATLRKFGMKV